MKNYQKISITNDARVELHDKIGLTGAEISINHLPAGTSVPFVHSHKNDEEIYAILEGNGKVMIDDESIHISAGDWIRISPKAKRQFFADTNSSIRYICIQVKENSLEEYTQDDAIIQ